ncbi:MAG: hypothetical protein JW953_18165 [Anaerolineae bacterium]|nr:hypothetical protein [Anaerolineae bacterium]
MNKKSLLLFLLGLLVFSGVACPTKSPLALPPDIPPAASTSLPIPSRNRVSANNPAFEQIVNLGVPVGNGATPWHITLNSQTGLAYIFTEGLPILNQGNGLSVYDIAAGEFVAHVKINRGSPDPLDLQFDPHPSLLYALWQASFGEEPPTLSVINTESLQVSREIPNIETFAAAEGLLYAVTPDGLTVWAVDGDTLAKRNQTALTPATQNGPLAVNLAANRLYLARAANNGWTMEIFEADTLEPANTYLSTGSIENILPNPTTGQVYVVEGDNDMRRLYPLDPDGRPLNPPVTLGPRYIASGITLSPDGRHLYFSNGEIRPMDPAPNDETGPALMGLSTANLSQSQKISLLTNFDDLVIDPKTNQALALYPFDDLLYLVNLDTRAVKIIPTAIEIRDVLADPEAGQLFVSDDANRVRRLDDETFAVLAQSQLNRERYGLYYGLGDGELTLDKARNRLYVSGSPAFVLQADTLAETVRFDPGGQFAPDPGGDKVYLSHCGVTILQADTLSGDTLLPGSGPRNDEFVPNPCVNYSRLDSPNQLLYSLTPNGTPGSNSGNYLYVYDLTQPGLIYTDTNISLAQALPDPGGSRAFVAYARHSNRRLRDLVVSANGSMRYAHQLIGVGGKMGYSPPQNRLYLSDFHRLLALNGDTLDVIGEMPLPPDYSYYLAELDPIHECLYLAGYDGWLLVATGKDGRSREENLAALQAATTLPPAEFTPQGAILALASAPNGHLFARIAPRPDSRQNPRLFLSTDEGITWTDLGQTLPHLPVQDVAVSPAYPDDQTLLAALTGFGDTGGLYQSPDGGQTWNPAMTGLRDLWAIQLFIAPGFADEAGPQHELVFANTQHAGLHYSFDGGRHWTPLVEADPNDAFPAGGNSAAVAINRNGVVLAGQMLAEMDGLFRTEVEPDGTLSAWQKVLNHSLSRLAFAPAGRVALGYGAGLWRSADSGRTWQPGGAGLNNLDSLQAGRFLFSSQFADDRTAYLFFINLSGEASGRLYRSADGGQTWQPWSGPPDGKRITAVTLTPAGDFLLGDSGTGVTRVSPAALNWLKPTPPTTLFEIDDLAVSPNYGQDQTLLAIHHRHGLFKSTDGGQTWQLTNFPVRSTSFNGYRLAISPAYAQDQTIYAATGFSLHRSTDGGQTWQIFLWPEVPLQASAVALSPHFAGDHTLLAGAPTAVLRSNDGGDTWQEVLARPEEAGPVKVLTFAPSGKVAYAWFDYYHTLFVSTDGGQNWQTQPGQAGEYFSVAAAATAPDDSLTLAPEFPPQLWQINKLGQDWRLLTETLPESLSEVQTIAYNADGALLAGGQHGIFESLDNGQSWQPRNKGLLPEPLINFLRLADSHWFIVLREGNIFVSADGGNSWREISVVK